MTKTEIKKEMLTYTDGAPFISIKDYARMMRIGKDAARAELSGIEYIVRGKRKDYLIEDIANKLASRKQCI